MYLVYYCPQYLKIGDSLPGPFNGLVNEDRLDPCHSVFLFLQYNLPYLTKDCCPRDTLQNMFFTTFRQKSPVCVCFLQVYRGSGLESKSWNISNPSKSSGFDRIQIDWRLVKSVFRIRLSVSMPIRIRVRLSILMPIQIRIMTPGFTHVEKSKIFFTFLHSSASLSRHSSASEV